MGGEKPEYLRPRNGTRGYGFSELYMSHTGICLVGYREDVTAWFVVEDLEGANARISLSRVSSAEVQDRSGRDCHSAVPQVCQRRHPSQERAQDLRVNNHVYCI